MRLRNAMCIEDLRRIAKRNVPGVFFEYMEAGSYSEHTRDANIDDMRAIKLAFESPEADRIRDDEKNFIGDQE